MITIFIAKKKTERKFIYSIIVMKAFAPYASTRTILLCSLWKGSANEIRKQKVGILLIKVDSCLAFYEAESTYHMHGKELLYRWFKRQNFQVDIEYYLPEIKQRPDVL